MPKISQEPININKETSTVALMDRTLYVLVAASPSVEDINNVIYLCQKAVNEKTVSYILVDLSLSEGFSKLARKIWSEFIQNASISKLAFFGGDIYTETTVSFIVGASGIDNCKLFQSKETAQNWLNQEG